MGVRSIGLWLRVVLALSTFWTKGCVGLLFGGAPSEEALILLRIEYPRPALPGTLLRVEGVDLEQLGPEPVLLLGQGGSEIARLERRSGSRRGEYLFRLDLESAERLGEGLHVLEAILEGQGKQSEAFVFELEIASTLPLEWMPRFPERAHRNDILVISGQGFISPSEGELNLRVEGDFTSDRGIRQRVEAALPLNLLEFSSRERAVVVLSTRLGGVRPGNLVGEAWIERRLNGGQSASTGRSAIAIQFGPPVLYSIDGTMASIGRRVLVRGAGFVGGQGGTDEATVLRIQGEFRERAGVVPRRIEAEIIPRVRSGKELELVIDTAVRDGKVVSKLFDAQRGVFEGRATPIVIANREEVRGESVPFRLTLGPPVQVVWLRFLPSYYQALSRFGLALAEEEIAQGIVQRIEEIYEGYNVDIRLEEPEDFDRSVVTVVEIGGPDPNGRGLFGYDNSPGKDVGNLRMYDTIGGANAETQADGYPGYGGVFIESFLWWSSHPELPGERPRSSPDVDPLFDEIFDPVRRLPARRAEIQGQGPPDRVEAVRRAIRALANIIGETTAHELGHSFGLAQPYGPPTSFHRENDGEGCLMDSGIDRPFAERAALPGAPRTRFCDEEPAYLRSILGP
ncbi:MAG: hypothetical protein RMJ84_07675 [Sandaracinaceae bacterium]|nr:hypothetical protein [Sandaracinaceae bacterium]